MEAKGISHQIDPECAIFVCNKWDQVPNKSEGEEEKVWKDIARKLQTCWPTERNVDITRQMFKMCVTKVRHLKIELYIFKYYLILRPFNIDVYDID